MKVNQTTWKKASAVLSPPLEAGNSQLPNHPQNLYVQLYLINNISLPYSGSSLAYKHLATYESTH